MHTSIHSSHSTPKENDAETKTSYYNPIPSNLPLPQFSPIHKLNQKHFKFTSCDAISSPFQSLSDEPSIF